MQAAERWTEHTRRLPPLQIGNCVRVQNQTGPHPLKWDKTGHVVEVKQFDQYIVKMDGSGRTTLRNRKFLRKFIPTQQQKSRRTIIDDLPLSRPLMSTYPQQRSRTIPIVPQEPPHQQPEPFETLSPEDNQHTEPPTIPNNDDKSVEDITTTNPASERQQIFTPRKKMPLALRRLADHNEKGLKE